VAEWRNRHGFTVTPPNNDLLDVPPSQTLKQATATARVRKAWNKLGFSKDGDGNGSLTHIQQQTWPIIARGYDVLAFAATGRGKTLAFGAPALEMVYRAATVSNDVTGRSVISTRNTERHWNPLPISGRTSALLVVVQATKEMVDQIINADLGRLARFLNLKIRAIRNNRDVKTYQGDHVLVGTPVQLAKMRTAKHLTRVRMIVLDEADMLVDEYQTEVASIVRHDTSHRPQIIAVSASTDEESTQALKDLMPAAPWIVHATTGQQLSASVEYNMLKAPPRLFNRSSNSFNASTSTVSFWAGLATDIVNTDRYAAELPNRNGNDRHKLMLFLPTRALCDSVQRRMQSQDFPKDSLYMLHGRVSDEKGKRSVGFNKFKEAGPGSVLITTTVSARGLDVYGVTIVVTGIPFGTTLKEKRNGVLHCTGRTGRASAKGTALIVTPEAGLWARNDPASSLLQWLEPSCANVWTYARGGELRQTRQVRVASMETNKQPQSPTTPPKVQPAATEASTARPRVADADLITAAEPSARTSSAGDQPPRPELQLYQLLYQGVGAPNGKLALDNGSHLSVAASALIRDQATDRICTWPLQAGRKYAIWDVGTTRSGAAASTFAYSRPLPRGAFLRTTGEGNVHDYVVGGVVDAHTTTYNIVPLELHSRVRKQSVWRQFFDTVPQQCTKAILAGRLLDAGELRYTDQELRTFFPTREVRSLSPTDRAPAHSPSPLQLPLSLFLSGLHARATKMFGDPFSTDARGNSDFGHDHGGIHGRQQVIYCAALQSADAVYRRNHGGARTVSLDAELGSNVSRARVWDALSAAHDESAVEQEFAAQLTAFFDMTVADVPGADLHEYTESTRIPVVTYVAWADHLLRLMENLRPLPQHAPANQARFSTREVEFYNAVRAGIPEKMDGSHMRTDLSRQVIGIRDTCPRRLVDALVTGARQTYVDSGPLVTADRALELALSGSAMLANTFYSDLDRSNDRIEAAQQAKSAKTNYCYLPVPTWATPEFCRSRRYIGELQTCIDASGATKHTLLGAATLLRITAPSRHELDEFKIQYRAAVHKMERWAQAASRDGSTADSDTEIAGLLGAHRLLLETCERRGTYFVDWVTTTIANEGAERRQNSLPSLMRRYINVTRTDDKRADVNQPRYHHRHVLQAFLASDTADDPESEDAELALLDMSPEPPYDGLLDLECAAPAPRVRHPGDTALALKYPVPAWATPPVWNRSATSTLRPRVAPVPRQVADGYHAGASTPSASRHRREVTFAIGQHGRGIKYSADAFDTVDTLLHDAARADARLSLPVIAVHDGHTLRHDELLHDLAAGTIYVLDADEQRAEDSEIVAEEHEPRPKRKRLLRESPRTGMGR